MISTTSQPPKCYYRGARPLLGAASQRLKLKGLDADTALLQDVTIGLIGLGAVNGVLIGSAAQMGIGHVIACDPANYAALSHQTQSVLPEQAAECLPKAEVQCERAHRINPGCEILCVQASAQELPRFLLRKLDVLAVAGDNIDAIIWAARMAIDYRLPLLESVVYGESWLAYLRRYNLTDPESVCPVCNLSDQEWKTRTQRHGCSIDQVVKPGRVPTQTLPLLCHLSAQLGLSELIKQTCGQTELLLDGEELVYSLQTHKILRTRFERNPDCRLTHRPAEHVDLPQHPEAIVLRDLAAAIGCSQETAHITAELPWISQAACNSSRCERVTQVNRFARLLSYVGSCRCGAPLIAGTVSQHSAIPAANLQQNYDRPLSELGLQPGATVTISHNDERVHFYLSDLSLEEWVAANSDPSRDEVQ